jgi:hypothetical protein
MKKSGLADSPFFLSPPPPPRVEAHIPAAPKSEIKVEPVAKVERPKTQKMAKQTNIDTVIPSNHDTTVSSNQDSMLPNIHGVTIDLVRKAVKEFGKEAATHRFTVSEKKELADIIYTYKNQGTKTTENEITRIAVNFLVEDYKVNGKNSVLHKILEALNG